MSSDDSWGTIQKDLEQLLKEGEGSPLYPAIEKLQHWLDARAPVPYAELISAFRQLNAASQSGQSLDTLIKQVQNGGPIQPDMQVQGNLYQAQFQILIGEIRDTSPKPDRHIPVAVVLLVMNAMEAQALAAGKALQEYSAEAREDFDKLRNLLEENEQVNWVESYKERPEDWQLFKDSAETVEQLVRRILGTVDTYKKKLTPEFHNIRDLNNDRPRLKYLREKGCVIIMDTISMHHPDIQRTFRRSLLDAYSNTLVVRITPFYTIEFISICDILLFH
jgi:hypothetical protein